jgi:DNA-binding transcriptional regulator GbsR (MarR family)
MSPETTPPAELNPKELAFIEKFAQHYERVYGIPRIGGRIWAYLLISETPRAIEDLCTALHASHGSISTNLRLLMMLGLVQKFTFAGQRRNTYRFSTHAWDETLQKRLDSIQQLERMAQQAVDDLQPEGVVRQRFDEMLTWIGLATEKYHQLLEEWGKRPKP